LATSVEILHVPGGLSLAPGSERIRSDAQQVGLGTTRKTKASHWLARLWGKTEGLPDPRKYVALGNAAGITFINGRTKRS
jgi:hypothetical protein